MPKPIHKLPGVRDQPMLSFTVKTAACGGILHLFLSHENMFLSTKVNVFMALNLLGYCDGMNPKKKASHQLSVSDAWFAQLLVVKGQALHLAS